jgi:hypothetical protein
LLSWRLNDHPGNPLWGAFPKHAQVCSKIRQAAHCFNDTAETVVVMGGREPPLTPFFYLYVRTVKKPSRDGLVSFALQLEKLIQVQRFKLIMAKDVPTKTNLSDVVGTGYALVTAEGLRMPWPLATSFTIPHNVMASVGGLSVANEHLISSMGNAATSRVAAAITTGDRNIIESAAVALNPGEPVVSALALAQIGDSGGIAALEAGLLWLKSEGAAHNVQVLRLSLERSKREEERLLEKMRESQERTRQMREMWSEQNRAAKRQLDPLKSEVDAIWKEVADLKGSLLQGESQVWEMKRELKEMEELQKNRPKIFEKIEHLKQLQIDAHEQLAALEKKSSEWATVVPSDTSN